jgi:hypothetical protein
MVTYYCREFPVLSCTSPLAEKQELVQQNGCLAATVSSACGCSIESQQGKDIGKVV